MRAVVFGATGQLGSALLNSPIRNMFSDIICPTHKECPIEDHLAVKHLILNTKPSVLFNFAALHDLFLCEQNEEKANALNGQAVMNLAQICSEIDCFFISVSTNYVFDGAKLEPYTELDNCRPVQAYGRSKLLGEYLAGEVKNCRKLIIRTSALFGHSHSSQKGPGFFDRVIKAIKERQVAEFPCEQKTSITYIPHFLFGLEHLLCDVCEGRDLPELIHLSNKGGGTWFDFACFLAEKDGFKGFMPRDDKGKDHRGFIRPLNSILSSQYEHSFEAINLPCWREAIDHYHSNL